MREMKFVRLVSRLENAAALDPLVERARAVVNSVIRPQPVRDVLHGVPVGHPVHPLLVLVPTGAWVSAAVLDLLPGNDRAARTLVGLGVVSVLPTAAAGWTDWSELHEQQTRVGLVHASANVVATALYAASFVQRARGRRTSGKVLGMLGLAVVSGGGYLGGHLSYRQAAGANHAEDVPHRFPSGWQDLAPLDELPERETVVKEVGGVPLLAFRRGDRVSVLSNVCSHLSGPLDEGAVGDRSGEACVSCPWHGSVFSLDSGEVLRGPATSPQPRFETRVSDGRVEVLLPNAG
ncbi:(2Fe-2S)-binding protein [Rathayibacter sp. Leaf299]|uniref:Rieske 2Fe-2S domain-containing protein n=1 Tax=Rathayibacter sp. Leaf299 TaxID=1736328 RepID=UPI0006FA065D|nr:Rieske 2Fe-2S domain-containing protein [Rathayibacter sp. Leaf299]KQQ22062.1 (2Fe-2S)-binding protein [Rathayibacter sp. Leaf299]